MPSDLLGKIPQWLKSLHQMENELRSAARQSLLLRKDEASEYLAEARRLLEKGHSATRRATNPQTVHKHPCAKTAKSRMSRLCANRSPGARG